MDYLNSIRAALKAAARVVAIPIEGHAPICIKARLLKRALKGVTIDSVKVLENRWLKVIGRAQGGVRTSSSFAPMDRGAALRMIWDWVERERKKRTKIINQGILSASKQRAMKLKAAEQAGIEALLETQKEEAEILAEARASVSVLITPLDAEARADLIAEYSDFRRLLPNRKRGSVILWELAKLKEEKAKLVKNQGRRNKIMVLRRGLR
jgi:hypothetical protein